jgi:hypothetical protein
MNYQVKIITNDKPLLKESEPDDSDYEYLYDDELQILSESGEFLFNLKGYRFKNYEIVDNYLIVDIDEGHKFTLDNIFINLDTFIIYYQIIKYKERYYRINFDKIDKKIIFEFNNKYDIKYFFENSDKIMDEYEYDRHKFDTTQDTLLKSIFDLFGKNVDNNSQIKIDGLTYGMSNNDIKLFKNIIRVHTKTIERQLFEVLFGNAEKFGHKSYDIDLTIYYKDNGCDKNFKIVLECKDKELIHIGERDVYYGYYDSHAKLKLI